ncbi:MAG: hypothetical protein GXO27_01985 [Chlorobi bacterium]|nr:hypothetical protein [Chlorobiota bacterium]
MTRTDWTLSSVEEPKEVERRLIRWLEERGMALFRTEGVVPAGDRMHFFERFQASPAAFSRWAADVERLPRPLMLPSWFARISGAGLYNPLHYRFLFALTGRYPLKNHIWIHTPDCSRFGWMTYDAEGLEEKPMISDNCKELSDRLVEITDKRGGKKFFRKEKLSCVDACLRQMETPYPGNFDGLIFDRETLRPLALVEFSKVEWVYAKGKDLARHLSLYCSDRKPWWKQDGRRWQTLSEVATFFDIPALVIWWGTGKGEFALAQLQSEGSTCARRMKFYGPVMDKQALRDALEKILNQKIIEKGQTGEASRG